MRKEIYNLVVKKVLPEYVHAAKLALGYYLTETIIDKILTGINTPASGIKEFILKKKSKALTDRELDVIKLLYMGLSNQEIADELCVDKRTIESHRRNIRKKLRVKNAAGIIKYAVKHNLI